MGAQAAGRIHPFKVCVTAEAVVNPGRITRNKNQSMGRSRGGLTSKIHAVVDTHGLPVRLALTAGEAHDNRLAGKLLSRLESGTMLLADRGYDADWIRALAAEKGAWANIPPRCNRNDLYEGDSHDVILQRGLLVDLVQINWDEVRFFESFSDGESILVVRA
jgi:transposase